MSNFSKGKHAQFISDRSGMAFPYKEMVREWNGSRVHISEFEPKQPQLGPFRTVSDPQALKDARPEQNLAEIDAIEYGFDPVGYRGDALGLTGNRLKAEGSVGEVTVTT